MSKEKELTPKPGEMFSKNIEWYVGRDVMDIIGQTDNMELSGNAIICPKVLEFIEQYKLCRDYVIALTYSKNNIPLAPRKHLIKQLFCERGQLMTIKKSEEFKNQLEYIGIDYEGGDK